MRVAILFCLGTPLLAGTDRVRIATTTSVDNCGILDALLESFRKETGLEVDVIAVGSGKASRLGENGDVDCLLIHDPELAARFIEHGYGTERADVMESDFVIVGPPNDPAKLREARTPEDAFRRIAESKTPFISRGDESGTNLLELRIWGKAGLKPEREWYLESGQAMGATLLIAHEKKAYCLADTATFLTYKKKLELVPLFQGGMPNPYQFILVNPVKHPKINAHGAMKLGQWLIGAEARRVIESFEIGGVKPFRVR